MTHLLKRVDPKWLMLIALWMPAALSAQTAPAPAPKAPNDTPSIKVGATIVADYTYNSSPEIVDADSNRVHLSSFNVTRAYINVTGNISHLMAFRVTPDIARETGAGASLAGSLVFRLKYAYAQLLLDDWVTKGSWVRLGIQQTPWVDFIEGIYRYRFQGTVFAEREGFLSSSDAGASVRYMLPSNYGDIHAGIYNGETYSKAEANNEKALQVRATLRPFPNASPLIKGLRGTIFFDADHYVSDAARRRWIAAVTVEEPHLNAGLEFLNTRDQTSVKKPEVAGRGFSVWATPRTTSGWEGLIRHEQMTPNTANDAQKRKRSIVGIAYWLPHIGSVSSAFLLNYEQTTFDNFAPAQPKQSKVALNGLINF